MATATARPRGSTSKTRRGSGQARATLRGRLEERREEIELAALTRVRAISDPAEVSDPAYVEGLRAAVKAAVAYGIETTGREAVDPPIPVALLAQTRMAARVGIPLDTVLRRYFAGYSLLGYFILEEASNAGIADGDELKRLLGTHAGIFDRLLATVGEEHGRESEALAQPTASRRQAERIERLLAGELVDTSDIPYDFDGWHLGLVASGSDTELLIRRLAEGRDCQLLLLHGSEAVWAWLGTRRPLDPADLLRSAGFDDERGERIGGENDPGDAPPVLAVGEPADSLSGWRRTHRQAIASLPVAKLSAEPTVRYADVALAAAVLQDDLLCVSLRSLYLEPLTRDQDGTLVETLRSYIAAGSNASSAAAALGISRQAVTKRLQSAEERIGRPLHACLLDLDAALRLAELDTARQTATNSSATDAH